AGGDQRAALAPQHAGLQVDDQAGARAGEARPRQRRARRADPAAPQREHRVEVPVVAVAGGAAGDRAAGVAGGHAGRGARIVPVVAGEVAAAGVDQADEADRRAEPGEVRLQIAELGPAGHVDVADARVGPRPGQAAARIIDLLVEEAEVGVLEDD